LLDTGLRASPRRFDGPGAHRRAHRPTGALHALSSTRRVAAESFHHVITARDLVFRTISAPSCEGGDSSYTTVTTLTGGTGKFSTIRGTLRGVEATDFKTGLSGVKTEGEYWFEK
jgi:hypothetical protein